MFLKVGGGGLEFSHANIFLHAAPVANNFFTFIKFIQSLQPLQITKFSNPSPPPSKNNGPSLNT